MRMCVCACKDTSRSSVRDKMTLKTETCYTTTTIQQWNIRKFLTSYLDLVFWLRHFRHHGKTSSFLWPISYMTYENCWFIKLPYYIESDKPFSRCFKSFTSYLYSASNHQQKLIMLWATNSILQGYEMETVTSQRWKPYSTGVPHRNCTLEWICLSGVSFEYVLLLKCGI